MSFNLSPSCKKVASCSGAETASDFFYIYISTLIKPDTKGTAENACHMNEQGMLIMYRKGNFTDCPSSQSFRGQIRFSHHMVVMEYLKGILLSLPYSPISAAS